MLTCLMMWINALLIKIGKVEWIIFSAVQIEATLEKVLVNVVVYGIHGAGLFVYLIACSLVSCCLMISDYHFISFFQGWNFIMLCHVLDFSGISCMLETQGEGGWDRGYKLCVHSIWRCQVIHSVFDDGISGGSHGDWAMNCINGSLSSLPYFVLLRYEPWN